MLLEPGLAIGGYTVVRHLGRGVSGVVYQATDGGRTVAIKVMLPESAADEAARVRFLREAEALIPLRHRNLVSTFECGVHEGAPYLVMELLAGTTLRERLRGDPLPVASALDIVIQLCDGLQFTHEHGIVHRDVKPANIWLLPNGGVKLLDFGLARFAGSSLTRAGDVVGSAAYMAPEQLAGLVVDGRADLFAAGVILFELLSGRRPFNGDNIAAVMEAILHEPAPALRTIVPGLSEEIYLAVDTALQKDPADRYSHVADFASDLRLARYLVDAPPAPGRQGSGPRSLVDDSVSTDATVLVSPRRLDERTAGRAHSATAETVAAMPAADPAAESETVLKIVAPAPAADSSNRPQDRAVPATSGRRAHPERTSAWPPGRALMAAAVVVVAVLAVAAAMLLRRPDTSPTAAPGAAPAAASGTEKATGGGVLDDGQPRALRVNSTPPGASVIVDGRDTGLRTPAVLSLSGPAPAVVELRAGDKLRQTVQITDAVLATGALEVEMMPARPTPRGTAVPESASAGGDPAAARTGRANVAVHVTGGYPFEISGCGRSSAAATEHELEVSAPCSLHLRSVPYFMDVSLPIGASSGRVEVAAPQLAHVQFRSRFEWCTVVLGGRALGSPPVEVDVASGTYRVEVQCPDRSYVIQDLVIEPGRSTRRLDDLLH